MFRRDLLKSIGVAGAALAIKPSQKAEATKTAVAKQESKAPASPFASRGRPNEAVLDVSTGIVYVADKDGIYREMSLFSQTHLNDPLA